MKNYSEKLSKFTKMFLELKSSRNKYDKNDGSNKSEANDKLIKINKNLNEGTNMLGESIRVMRGVNEKDKETMGSLHRQTNMMKDATGKLYEADSFLSRSDNVIRNMMKRVFSNKLVLFALIILLGLINSFLFYIKIKYKILGK
jgi:hypothetical protein